MPDLLTLSVLGHFSTGLATITDTEADSIIQDKFAAKVQQGRQQSIPEYKIVHHKIIHNKETVQNPKTLSSTYGGRNGRDHIR